MMFFVKPVNVLYDCENSEYIVATLSKRIAKSQTLIMRNTILDLKKNETIACASMK